jgi:hypothetical protein
MNKRDSINFSRVLAFCLLIKEEFHNVIIQKKYSISTSTKKAIVFKNLTIEVEKVKNQEIVPEIKTSQLLLKKKNQ